VAPIRAVERLNQFVHVAVRECACRPVRRVVATNPTPGGMTMDDDSAPAAGHEAFDLSATYIHLGLGARATPLPDFEWTDAVSPTTTAKAASS
jgi:hypothetical protein